MKLLADSSLINNLVNLDLHNSRLDDNCLKILLLSKHRPNLRMLGLRLHLTSSSEDAVWMTIVQQYAWQLNQFTFEPFKLDWQNPFTVKPTLDGRSKFSKI